MLFLKDNILFFSSIHFAMFHRNSKFLFSRREDTGSGWAFVLENTNCQI